MWMNESHIDMVINVTELRMPFLRDHVKRGCIKQWEEYILLKHITFFSFEKNTHYFPFTIEYIKDHLSDLQFGA